MIKIAVADGIVTDKEHSIIYKKAESLGEDLDEVELILNGELAIIKNELYKNRNNNESNFTEIENNSKPNLIFAIRTYFFLLNLLFLTFIIF